MPSLPSWSDFGFARQRDGGQGRREGFAAVPVLDHLAQRREPGEGRQDRGVRNHAAVDAWELERTATYRSGVR